MSLRLLEIRPRNVLWMLAVAILLVAVSPALVAAQESKQVGLVVQFGDGRLETRCISFEGDEIGGDALLAQSGLEVLLDPSSGMGVTVCRIEDEGCNHPAEHCFCQCMGGGECAYWNYFYREPGAETWTYSALGAGLRKARPGAVEAWVWGDGHSPPAGDLNFEAICAPASPTPSPEPEVVAEPATPTAQPRTVADPTATPTPAPQPAASTATTGPAEAISTPDTDPGLADYWPFGLMLVALLVVGVLVWLRQA
jgi:hypothetical protein